MASRGRISVLRGGVLCALAVAALSAAVGHAAIDALGDVLLAHDTYDDVPHDARSIVAALALCLLLCGAARSVFAGLRECGGRAVARRAFRPALIPFVGTSTALAFPLLGFMEFLDACAAGTPPDDLADLLGGSLVLGTGTLAVTGVAIGTLAVAALRWFFGARDSLVRVVRALFERVRATHAPVRNAPLRRALRRGPMAFVARCVSKRGPPLLVAIR